MTTPQKRTLTPRPYPFNAEWTDSVCGDGQKAQHNVCYDSGNYSTWWKGGMSRRLLCPKDYYVTEICQSGENTNCLLNKGGPHKNWHQELAARSAIQCTKVPDTWSIQEVSRHPSIHPITWHYSGDGTNKYEAKCPDNEIIVGTCTSGSQPNCYDDNHKTWHWTGVACMKTNPDTHFIHTNNNSTIAPSGMTSTVGITTETWKTSLGKYNKISFGNIMEDVGVGVAALGGGVLAVGAAPGAVAFAAGNTAHASGPDGNANAFAKCANNMPAKELCAIGKNVGPCVVNVNVNGKSKSIETAANLHCYQ